MIKVSYIIQKSSKKNNPRLDWLMSQKIYIMHRDIKNKETSTSAIFLTSMSENIQVNFKNENFEE